MQIHFYSPVGFEPWDWRSSVETGIGGSETSHVEMAWRLAHRGHTVVSYNQVPHDCPGFWRETAWQPLDMADWTKPGLWILYRCPEKALEFEAGRPDQVVWLMMQDWDYVWKPEYVERLDRIMVLSHAHEQYVVRAHPELASKLFVTANGVKVDLIETLERGEIPERNPYRVMYASSPDRGLLHLTRMMTRAQEFLPELELHSFYGFQNIDKMKGYFVKQKAEILDAFEKHPRFYFHGRVNQEELYREWMKSALLCYPSDFFETGFITGQEAQCLGAIPITSPNFAQGEVCQHGIQIPGSAWNDSLVQARYVGAIVRLATQPELQEQIRAVMVPEARKRCDWENFVSGWEEEAERCFAERSQPAACADPVA